VASTKKSQASTKKSQASPKSQEAKPAVSKTTPHKDSAKPAQPSRASIARIAVDDALAPLTQGDALELFANQVVADAGSADYELAKKFDIYWYKVVIDLASQVIQKCAEKNVVATLDEIEKDRDRPGLLATFRERALRHKLARNLPADARTRLTAPERDRLVEAIISTGIAARGDPQTWDACWGRLTGWSPVIQAPEPEPAAPPGDGEAWPSEEPMAANEEAPPDPGESRPAPL
jgi:hypothetical protein